MRELRLGFVSEGFQEADAYCGKITAYDKATLAYLGRLDYTLASGEPHLDYLEVDASYQRRGVGKALVASLLSSLRVPYAKLRWAVVLPDGVVFKNRLDAFYATRGQDA